MGDILFTLPAIHALRHNFPRHQITFLTSREFMPLLAGFRDLDEVVSLDRSLFGRGDWIHLAQEICSLMVLLHQRRFALAIDFQGYGETALITWLTRSRQRWGTVYQSMRRYGYTRGIQRNPKIHPAESNLLLLKQCGLTVESVRNEFVVPESAMTEARQLFAKLGLQPFRPVLFIQPFTSSAQKNWPLENYIALANHWRDAGVQVVFGGGPAELPRLEPVSRAGFPIAAGAPLLVSAGLARLCTVLVGGDTGLLHIAVAMNKRVVMIQGPHRHPERFYPFRRPDWKLMPAMGAPIATVSVPEVIHASQVAFTDCASHFATAVGE